MKVILDAGPLVAFLNSQDDHHQWARKTLGTIAPPIATCEAVISETCFLMRRIRGGADAVLALVGRGILSLEFSLSSEVETVRKLMKKYATVPMSLADACLVRMTELAPRSVVMTLDSDFHIYRRSGRHVVPVVTPAT